uniref:Uncharacterized protein n=1 Tax=Magallana gigas TaxID=29159 RepID=A0A8W8MQH3_MAGGI
MYLSILLAFPLGALTACIRKDTTLTCKDFRDLASRTWRDVEIFRINRLSSGVNLKKFKVMHSLLRCDDIIGQRGVTEKLEDEVFSRNTRSQSEVETRDAIYGIITGGMLVLVIQCVAYGERP